jgi:hypothetical protein
MTDPTSFEATAREVLANPIARAAFLRQRRERGATTIKLYLDDVRSPPDDTWTVARTAAEAWRLLLAHEVECASLDHDLGICPTCTPGERHEGAEIVVMASLEAICGKGCRCDCHATGYDFVKWMAESGLWPQFKPAVHSANPVGKSNMLAVIHRHWRAP